MKTATWIVGALAAFLASTVDADGICYDHSHRNVAADFKTLKERGFSHVRTYASTFGIAQAVVDSGLRGMLGIRVNDATADGADVAAAVKAAASGAIDYVMVGNENLDHPIDMGAFIETIKSVKAQVKQANPNVRVGTVQRTTELINMDLTAMASVCDVIGVNVHPFFTGGAQNNMIGVAQDQWTKSKQRVNGYGKPLLLTETGWPSGGSSYAGNAATSGLAQAYWKQYKESGMYNSLGQSDKYYFQAFDTTYKVPIHPDKSYEGYFGLYNEGDGKAKVEGAGGVPAPAPTPAPTPEPTTTAPPTLEPASNATSGSADNEEGVSSSSASLGDAGEVGEEASAGVDLGIANNEEATADFTPSPEEGTETGDNTEKEGAAEANTQSSTGSSTAGVIVVILMGCAAVGGAFAFIYKARQKAAEVERAESKSFDMTVTPGGACVL